MSKTFILSAGWAASWESLNKLKSCQYVSNPTYAVASSKFRTTHNLWGHRTYTVSATEEDMLLFRLDSRYKDFKVFPHPEDPTDE